MTHSRSLSLSQFNITVLFSIKDMEKHEIISCEDDNNSNTKRKKRMFGNTECEYEDIGGLQDNGKVVVRRVRQMVLSDDVGYTPDYLLFMQTILRSYHQCRNKELSSTRKISRNGVLQVGWQIYVCQDSQSEK
ncbi:hypothetical protein OROMI_033720 [Orobanche minor]